MEELFVAICTWIIVLGIFLFPWYAVIYKEKPRKGAEIYPVEPEPKQSKPFAIPPQIDVRYVEVISGVIGVDEEEEIKAIKHRRREVYIKQQEEERRHEFLLSAGDGAAGCFGG